MTNSELRTDLMDVKTAIRKGDSATLGSLLAEDPSQANALIRWGSNDCILTHPLHYVSDMLFDGTLKRGAELPLIDALIHAGANPRLRGIFGETALHWAAMLGEDRLAQRLIPLSEIDLNDQKYNSSPLGWAVHGCYNPGAGNQGRQCEVASFLVAAGAAVEPTWLQSDQVRADPAMLAALSRGPSRKTGRA